jgi:hypothetical protein
MTRLTHSFAWTPHGTYRDLELFVQHLGFTPMEAILSATALGGEIMMHPHELGKVQPGYYADLILVNGDPLSDITVLTGPKNIDVVMIVSVEEAGSWLITQNGRIHKERKAGQRTFHGADRSLVAEAERLKLEEQAAEANGKK